MVGKATNHASRQVVTASGAQEMTNLLTYLVISIMLAVRISAFSTSAAFAGLPRALSGRAPLSSSLLSSSSFGAVSPTSSSSSKLFSTFLSSPSGEVDTKSYRVNFHAADTKAAISPWHDIPLRAPGGHYNMVTEIPKNTLKKYEISTKEPYNPIAQDIKKDKLRSYHGPIFWNYGALPQTWEDPTHRHPVLNVVGDNDPIDVVEIGSSSLATGSVTPVKVLGVLAMVDDGELDWKLVAIRGDDPLAGSMNDIGDVPAEVLSGIREWFRWYKTPDGKPLNNFGFEERYLNKKEAADIIEETHQHWKNFVATGKGGEKLWRGKA